MKVQRLGGDGKSIFKRSEMNALRLSSRLMVSLLIVILFIPFSSSFAENMQYTYDDLNRLKLIEYDNGTTVQYNYDEVSNILQKSSVSTVLTYTITTSTGSNGSITLSSATVVSGGSQTFTITPSPGYAKASIFVNGSLVGRGNSYPCSNVTANDTISASFVVQNFPDVPDTYWAYTNIQAVFQNNIMYQSDITGCGNGNYCPGTPVIREQVDAFIIRAL